MEIDGPLDEVCYVQVEQMRTISTNRLINYVGDIGAIEMASIEDVLVLFLDFPVRS